MATSITASNSSAPFNGYLLTDAAYVTSASILSGVGSVSPSFNFKVATPWPTINATELYITSNAPTGISASYVALQGSPDNTTWTTLTLFANPILTVAGGTANSATVTLQPNTPQYLRMSASVQAGSLANAAITMSLLF